MRNLRDEIKAKANEGGGWRPHPFGTFDGTVIDVSERTVPSGAVVFEVLVQTKAGRARASIWKNTYAEVEAAPPQDMPEAEERYVKSLARLVRLYGDLGLTPPDGDDHVAIETEAYDRLGELIGQACSVVVKEGRDEKNPIVFINAPGREKTAHGSTVRRTSSPEPTSAFEGSNPALDDIPF